MKKTLIFIVIFQILNSCSAWRKELKTGRGYESAIDNAIVDFYYTSKLFDNHSIFSISIDEIDNGKYLIDIFPSKNKFLPEPSDTIGSLNNYLPTNYLLKEDKLFYWNDSTKSFTKEMMSVLIEYKLIDSTNVNGFQYFPEDVFIIDERQKAVHYFICKNNIRNYKKVTTSIAYGYYTPPKLNCNTNKYKKSH